MKLQKEPITTTQLARYAGASGDWNRIHFDDPFARASGFPSVIAHGMLSMAFFGELAARYAGGPERVKRLRARFLAVTFPGDRITVEARELSRDADRGTAELALTAKKDDGTTTLVGSATVLLPPAVSD